jgi:plasmid stabilization system protein ParE
VTDLAWSPRAIEDLRSIRSFIGRNSGHYGALVAHQLIDAAQRRRVFPESGHVVPETNDPQVREIVWRSYRLVYRIRRESVEIVTVFLGPRLHSMDE